MSAQRVTQLDQMRGQRVHDQQAAGEQRLQNVAGHGLGLVLPARPHADDGR